jgi:hypothetical protein
MEVVMGIQAAKRMACALALVAAFDAPRLHAQVEIGTWVRQGRPEEGGGMTMTVEACCGASGRRLTYRIPGNTEMTLTVDSRMDGSDAPVMMGGKPSGETMAIKRIDARHAVTVLKMNGNQFGTSSAELSADGRTLTVEDAITSDQGRSVGQMPGKQKEIWIKK